MSFLLSKASESNTSRLYKAVVRLVRSSPLAFRLWPKSSANTSNAATAKPDGAGASHGEEGIPGTTRQMWSRAVWEVLRLGRVESKGSGSSSAAGAAGTSLAADSASTHLATGGASGVDADGGSTPGGPGTPGTLVYVTSPQPAFRHQTSAGGAAYASMLRDLMVSEIQVPEHDQLQASLASPTTPPQQGNPAPQFYSPQQHLPCKASSWRDRGASNVSTLHAQLSSRHSAPYALLNLRPNTAPTSPMLHHRLSHGRNSSPGFPAALKQALQPFGLRRAFTSSKRRVSSPGAVHPSAATGPSSEAGYALTSPKQSLPAWYEDPTERASLPLGFSDPGWANGPASAGVGFPEQQLQQGHLRFSAARPSMPGNHGRRVSQSRLSWNMSTPELDIEEHSPRTPGKPGRVKSTIQDAFGKMRRRASASGWLPGKQSYDAVQTLVSNPVWVPSETDQAGARESAAGTAGQHPQHYGLPGDLSAGHHAYYDPLLDDNDDVERPTNISLQFEKDLVSLPMPVTTGRFYRMASNRHSASTDGTAMQKTNQPGDSPNPFVSVQFQLQQGLGGTGSVPSARSSMQGLDAVAASMAENPVTLASASSNLQAAVSNRRSSVASVTSASSLSPSGSKDSQQQLSTGQLSTGQQVSTTIAVQPARRAVTLSRFNPSSSFRSRASVESSMASLDGSQTGAALSTQQSPKHPLGARQLRATLPDTDSDRDSDSESDFEIEDLGRPDRAAGGAGRREWDDYEPDDDYDSGATRNRAQQPNRQQQAMHSGAAARSRQADVANRMTAGSGGGWSEEEPDKGARKFGSLAASAAANQTETLLEAIDCQSEGGSFSAAGQTAAAGHNTMHSAAIKPRVIKQGKGQVKNVMFSGSGSASGDSAAGTSGTNEEQPSGVKKRAARSDHAGMQNLMRAASRKDHPGMHGDSPAGYKPGRQGAGSRASSGSPAAPPPAPRPPPMAPPPPQPPSLELQPPELQLRLPSLTQQSQAHSHPQPEQQQKQEHQPAELPRAVRWMLQPQQQRQHSEVTPLPSDTLNMSQQPAGSPLVIQHSGHSRVRLPPLANLPRNPLGSSRLPAAAVILRPLSARHSSKRLQMWSSSKRMARHYSSKHLNPSASKSVLRNYSKKLSIAPSSRRIVMAHRFGRAFDDVLVLVLKLIEECCEMARQIKVCMR